MRGRKNNELQGSVGSLNNNGICGGWGVGVLQRQVFAPAWKGQQTSEKVMFKQCCKAK